MEWFALVFLCMDAVFLAEAHADVVVCLREVVDDTVDIGLDVFRALYEEVLVSTDV